MATPKPGGITSHWQAGNWCHLTWNRVPGAEMYEHEHQWNSGKLASPESSLFAVAPGTTAWCKIRNMVEGRPSGWVTVTVNDRGQIVHIDGGDDPEPPPPETPHDLVNVWTTTYEAELSWAQDGEVEGWRVIASASDGGAGVDTVVSDPEITVNGIGYEAALAVEVRAVRGGIESVPRAVTLPAATYTPATPAGLSVTPGPTTLALEWEQDDDCRQWQVMWIESEVRRKNPRAPMNGTVQVAGQARHTITGLKPGTSYDLLVVARWRRSGYSAEGARDTVATLGGTDPRPAPPSIISISSGVDSISVRWEPAAGTAPVSSWEAELLDETGTVVDHVDTPARQHVFTDLIPSTWYALRARGINQAGAGAWCPPRRIKTGDDAPQPARPTNLQVHPGIDRAHVQWEQAGSWTHAMLDWGSAPKRVDAPATDTHLSGLQPSTRYTVVVTPYNGTTAGPAASRSFITGDDDPPPGDLDPRNVAVSYPDTGVIRLSWDASAPIGSQVDLGRVPHWFVACDELDTQQRVTERVNLSTGRISGNPFHEWRVDPGSHHALYLYRSHNGAVSRLVEKHATAPAREATP